MARDECRDLFFTPWRLLLSITVHTHGKVKSICFIHQVLKLFGKIRLLCDDIRHLYSTIIAHAQEPMKLLHLYTLVS
jgi:hypothetical protein